MNGVHARLGLILLSAIISLCVSAAFVYAVSKSATRVDDIERLAEQNRVLIDQQDKLRRQRLRDVARTDLVACRANNRQDSIQRMVYSEFIGNVPTPRGDQILRNALERLDQRKCNKLPSQDAVKRDAEAMAP